ncbi:MAG: class I SAM-dependent methyltransferase [Chitinophagaceae bacterium]|nr:class I SAM-dependent methyltransferase [Chitinophagaceae bacterium]
MKILSYIKYFFYLAWNWNISIAWHIIRQEIKGEKKYGINTTGADELKKLEDMGIDISHATIYMPASYKLLEDIFEQLSPNKSQTYPKRSRRTNLKLILSAAEGQTSNHFLDIGCGKGRALCVAAHYGYKKLTGIDLSKEFCAVAKENVVLTKQKIPGINFTIINNDAFYFEIPDDVDCIFLFNPFDETIMSGVVENILESLQNHPRKMNIIYVNPLHKEYFIQAGFTETWHSKKMKYLEAVILEK